MIKIVILNFFVFLFTFQFTITKPIKAKNPGDLQIYKSNIHQISDDLIDSGPFVGAVTDASAIFIVKPVKLSKVKFEIAEDETFGNSVFTEEIDSDADKFNFTKIEIKTLKPDTKYYYRAVLDGVNTERVHSFKTFTLQKDQDFSFGFGSCQQGYGATTPDIYPVIGQDTLRFFLQIGDWTYPDFGKLGRSYNESFDKLEETYRIRYDYSYPFNSEVLSRFPVAYIYDDHDFAGNDADGTNRFKSNSIKAYDMFFPHYKMENPDNGIWQKFRFGDVEFFMLDLRTQRSSSENVFNSEGMFEPPAGHSMLSGFKINGEDQKTWLENSLKNSDAKWKVIVSSVIFNPRYSDALKDERIAKMFPRVQKGIIDKWAGFPEDIEFIENLIKDNGIKNVIMISGDSHSSYIDDGTNSVIPEISSSNLDTKNSKLGFLTQMAGYNIWNQGSYNDEGHAYGRVSFHYGSEEYALLEVVDQTGTVVLSYRLDAR